MTSQPPLIRAKLAKLFKPGTCWLLPTSGGYFAVRWKAKPYLSDYLSLKEEVHVSWEYGQAQAVCTDNFTQVTGGTLYVLANLSMQKISKAQFKTLWTLAQHVHKY